MIFLDTNVVSNFMQSAPNLQVCAWLDEQTTSSLYLPSVVVAEIYFGLNLLPIGKKRSQLLSAFEQFMTRGFVDRIVDFDAKAAQAYSVIRARKHQQGRPMGMADAQIAAIAQVHQAVIATRNVKDFEGCGVALINPFESQK